MKRRIVGSIMVAVGVTGWCFSGAKLFEPNPLGMRFAKLALLGGLAVFSASMEPDKWDEYIPW